MTGSVPEIKSVSCFGKWINEHGNHGVLYRGLADSEYQLESSLYRRLRSSEREIPKDIFIRALVNLIKIAKREKHDRKDGHKLSDLELLANLQHFGAATCLIDFTRNPLIALWFACQLRHKSDKKDKIIPVNGKIVAMNASHPDKFGIAEDGEEIQEFFSDKKLWKWIPPKQNHRIVAQQSIFVFGQPAIPDDKTIVSCIISHKNKDGILSELHDRYGISAESLFCDFPGFALEVHGHDKEYREWTAEDYFQFGIDNRQKGDYAAAIADYDEAIRLNPNDASAYESRGIAKARLDNYDAAIMDFNEAIRLNSKDAGTYYNRGNAKFRLDNYDAAIVDFNEAIRLNSKDADTYNNRGVAKARLGDYDAAIKDYNEAIHINPKYAKAHNNRGVAKANLNKHADVVKDYDKAITLNPEYALAYNNRGRAKLTLGDQKGALEDFRRANELNPEYKIPESLLSESSEGGGN